MKKTIRLFAILAILLGAVSCQNNDLDNGQIIDDGKLTVTATIVTPDATRVTYDVDNETSHTITPAWTVGDEIIGFDDDDHTFTFTVETVDGSGRATLSDGGYTPGSATKAYAIYYPGKTTANFTGSGASTKLAVDLSSQAGAALNDNAPVLMCATADISGGAITLDFTNQVAIIGVTQFKLPAAATLTSVSVDGLITTGKFEVNGSGDLELTPDEDLTTISATGSWATGEGNICETPLYFATLPTAGAKIALRANDGASDYGNLASISATNIVAGNYYYMKKNLGEPVAEVAGVKYGTIDDAFAAANHATSPVTITLLKDCSASARLPLSDTVGSGAVTLDLNGKDLAMTNQIRVSGRTLTIMDSSSDVLAEQGVITANYTKGRALYVEASSTLYFQGGTITHNGSGYGTVFVQTSTATFSGGKIISEAYRCVTGSTASTINFTGTIEVEQIDGAYQPVYVLATANISGGTFTRGGNGGYLLYTSNADAVANVTGGNFISIGSSTNPAVYANEGTINFSDGYVRSGGINPVGFDTGAHAYVTGGCFDKAIRDAYTKDSSDNIYVNVLNDDGATNATYPFKVTSAAEVVSVSQSTYTWKHGAIESAFKNADMRARGNGPANITLSGDAAASDCLEIGSGNTYAVTLDLAGHCLSSASSPALSVASDFSIIGTGSSEFETTGATALDVTAGTTTLSTASIVAATNAVTVNGGSLVVSGGHYYGGVADIVKNTGSVSVNGGRFRSEPAAALLASSYSAVSDAETFNTRDYGYSVVGVVATVNSTEYTSWSAAVAAANAYAGADATVTLQLQLDISGASAASFNNTSSKPIVLDLNGHTLSTSASEFLTTTGTARLTITDTNPVKGKITSSAYNIVNLATSGTTAYISGCILESTAPASSTFANAVVRGNYDSKTTRPIVVFENNARVYSVNAHTTVYAKYTTMTFNACEIISGKDEDNGFHALFFNTGGQVTINSDASFYSPHKSGDPVGAAVRSGTSNTASALTINGGWFHGGYSVNCGNGYSTRITFKGGYYNDDFSKYTYMTAFKYGTGKTIQVASPAATHSNATIGETLSYGFQVTDE